MKHGKNPTKAQKMLLAKYKLNNENEDNWLIVKDCPACFEIVSRITRERRVLNRRP